ncbi:hypothetical protein NDU88_008785 [Pleurodeles waltl]|uniref:Uncharacterized protein n=1 Tax=Pleurodeles waltl TaxID=8319 RepID=A0AAV7PT20_PLEWA|nr:hypothetical protein NDU88_008785 [Pleurodeles waltl]
MRIVGHTGQAAAAQPGSQATRPPRSSNSNSRNGNRHQTGNKGAERSGRAPAVSSQQQGLVQGPAAVGSAHHGWLNATNATNTSNAAGGKAAHSTAGSAMHFTHDLQSATTRRWVLRATQHQCQQRQCQQGRKTQRLRHRIHVPRKHRHRQQRSRALSKKIEVIISGLVNYSCCCLFKRITVNSEEMHDSALVFL